MKNMQFRLRLHGALPIAGLWLGSLGVLAQAVPGAPENSGVQPIGDTVYANTANGADINNSSTESIGVAIARNGNVVVGWEDDGGDLADLQATWTLFNSQSQPIIEPVEIKSIDPAFAGQTVTSRFLSYFRADKSPTPARTGWGPKIQANPFGDGFGMGSTSFELGLEVPAFAPIENNEAGENAGDYPTVQLLDNSGAPLGVVSGASDAYAEPAGNIRIGDWGYLSTGNIVVAGESRQTADLVSVYGGAAAANHVYVRIMKPDGTEVKAAQLASATPTKAEMWHGIGTIKSGFGVRFGGDDGRAKVRLFDNAGTPTTTTNIDLGTLVGNPVAATGGRGDGVGFHGNGNDAYAVVGVGNDEAGKPTVLVTVLNANGTVRWSRSAADDIDLLSPGRADVAIDALGRVAVTYDTTSASASGIRGVLARVFDAKGTPLGGTFYVSERETPETLASESRRPRIAFRNDTIAVVWETLSAEVPDVRTVALRQFVVPVKPGSIEAAGLSRIVADTPLINQGLNALGNWEPYVSVLGTSTFLIEGNAFAQGTEDKQRFVVGFQPAAGGAYKLGEAVFADNGTPYRGPINASRQNGNPGRVGGDPRPGAVNFVAGGEMSPHTLAEFGSDNRWNLGYARATAGGTESRYGTVQPFSLNPATLEQKSLAKAFDAAHGRRTEGVVFSDQNTRFGGDIVGLGNGNFVVATEDRSRLFREDGNCAVATIIRPDGSIVKETFKVGDGDYWANLAAFKGGFALRVAGVLYLYDNDGNSLGSLDQNVSGESFDRGRGDGTRIAGHVNQPYVYLAGKVSTAPVVRVAAFHALTKSLVAVAEVSEGGFRGDFDRATVAADALGRVVVSWVAKPDGYELQQVAARVLALENNAFRALTPSFLPFVNQAPVGGIRTYQMSLAMTTRQILVAAKGEINLANKPEQGANSPTELNFFTVVSHPAPADDPTPSANAAQTVVGTSAPAGLTGGTFSNVVVDEAAKTITADLPATGEQGFLTISPARPIKGVQRIGNKLVIQY